MSRWVIGLRDRRAHSKRWAHAIKPSIYFRAVFTARDLTSYITYSEKRLPTGIWIAKLVVVELLTREGERGYCLRSQGVLNMCSGTRNSVHDHSACGPDRSSPTDLLSCSRGGGVEANRKVLRSLSLIEFHGSPSTPGKGGGSGSHPEQRVAPAKRWSAAQVTAR